MTIEIPGRVIASNGIVRFERLLPVQKSNNPNYTIIYGITIPTADLLEAIKKVNE